MDKHVKEVDSHLQYMKAEEFEYSVNVSLKYHYIYVETPKVGCSTIKDTLQRMELDYPDLERKDSDDIHRRCFSPLISPSQTNDINRLLGNPNYFVFCFVRNPYARLLSAYLDKIVTCRHPKRAILKAMGEDSSDLSRKISFQDFVDTVCCQSIMQMDVHWRTQYYQTLQNTINYDFIGRMEDFQHDCEYVFSKIRDDYADYFRSETRHATDSAKHLTELYNDNLKEKVFNKYRIDFDYFGYDENALF